jgi:hypothetical protein
VDEFAFRKGRRAGPLIVDLARSMPRAVLPDTQVATVAAWRKQYPPLTIITPDRAGAFAAAVALVLARVRPRHPAGPGDAPAAGARARLAAGPGRRRRALPKRGAPSRPSLRALGRRLPPWLSSVARTPRAWGRGEFVERLSGTHGGRPQRPLADPVAPPGEVAAAARGPPPLPLCRVTPTSPKVPENHF